MRSILLKGEDFYLKAKTFAWKEGICEPGEHISGFYRLETVILYGMAPTKEGLNLAVSPT